MKLVSAENLAKFVYFERKGNLLETNNNSNYINIDSDVVKNLLKKSQNEETKKVIANFIEKLNEKKDPDEALAYFKNFMLILEEKGVLTIQKRKKSVDMKDKYLDELGNDTGWNNLQKMLSDARFINDGYNVENKRNEANNLRGGINFKKYFEEGGFDLEARDSIRKITEIVSDNISQALVEKRKMESGHPSL